MCLMLYRCAPPTYFIFRIRVRKFSQGGEAAHPCSCTGHTAQWSTRPSNIKSTYLLHFFSDLLQLFFKLKLFQWNIRTPKTTYVTRALITQKPTSYARLLAS